MRLLVPLPPGFTRRVVRAGEVAIGPGLALLATPLVPTAASAASWLRRAAAPGRMTVTTTADGWPVTVVEGATSIAAHVRVLDFAGGIVAHVESAAARVQALALVAAARADLASTERDDWRSCQIDPPEGWARVDRPGQTLWLAPSCARERLLIRVYDAEPSGGPARPAVGARHLRLRDGLVAEVVTRGGSPVVAEARIWDARYLYRFRLESDPACFAAASRHFARLVLSMRPLRPAPAGLPLFAAWQD